jgi:tetratricopeptide (TPR) repeat protein
MQILKKWTFLRAGNTAARLFTARDEATPHSAEQVARFEAAARENAADGLNAIASAITEQDRFYALPSAAIAAYVVGRFDDAQHFADEALQIAQRYEDDWNHGNAVNAAHTVRGLLALDRGDIPQAVAELKYSGTTNGSPQLDSFGPSMRLAKALLRHGEREAVLCYFEQCRRFWKGGTSVLDIWSAKVENGGIPNFTFNAYR